MTGVGPGTADVDVAAGVGEDDAAGLLLRDVEWAVVAAAAPLVAGCRAGTAPELDPPPAPAAPGLPSGVSAPRPTRSPFRSSTGPRSRSPVHWYSKLCTWRGRLLKCHRPFHTHAGAAAPDAEVDTTPGLRRRETSPVDTTQGLTRLFDLDRGGSPGSTGRLRCLRGRPGVRELIVAAAWLAACIAVRPPARLTRPRRRRRSFHTPP